MPQSGKATVYAYVGGNPLSRTDPSGQNAIAVGIGLIGAGGALVCYLLPGCWDGVSQAVGSLLNPPPSSAAPPDTDMAPPPLPAILNPPTNASRVPPHCLPVATNKDPEPDCAEEIAGCSELCAEAQTDGDRRLVYTGSIEGCMKSCLPEKCGGDLKWKGYRDRNRKRYRGTR